MTGSPLDRVRSILETPILDERKWAKVPLVPADAVLLDLEDSVAPARKDQARDKVCALLRDPGPLGDRVLIPRANNLQTPWGEADLAALAEQRPALVAYPKVRDPEEIHRVLQHLHSGGADPQLVLIIETARAVLNLEVLAGTPGVAGLVFGPSDLALDTGWSLFADGGLFADAYTYPKAKLALAGAAYGLRVYDTVFVTDLRDEQQVRAAAQHARQLGYAGMATFYPPHVPEINEVFTPSPEELQAARRTVLAYEEALASGRAALKVEERAVIVQDYERARRLLRLAPELPGEDAVASRGDDRGSGPGKAGDD